VSEHLVDAVERIAARCWQGTHWRRVPKGFINIKEPLKRSHLEKHINGGPAVGLAPIVPGTSETPVLVFDLDSHRGEATWEEVRDTADGIMRRLRGRDMNPFAVRSSGGKGIHIYVLFSQACDAYSAREFAREVLGDCGLSEGTKGGVKAGHVEIFPKQAEVPEDGFGNMFALPFSGESVPLDPQTLEIVSFESVEASDWPESPPVPKLERPERPQQHIGQLSTDLDELRSQLQAIPNEGDASLDYDLWRNVIFGIHHATQGSDEGLALAHEFSQRSAKYDPDVLEERVWPYVKSERGGKVITARTITAMARENGWRDDVLCDFDVITDDELSPRQETEGVASEAPNAITLDSPASAGNRFRVLSEEEFTARPAPEWIIKNVLPQAGLVLLIGASGSGKSFIALDMAGSIARGEPWRDRKVRGGRAVVIAAEGAGGFRNRLVAYDQYHEIERTGIGVIPDTPNFLHKNDVRDVVLALKDFGPVDVIIVDTLAQVTAGGNENSGEDMGTALANCKALHQATGATVMVVHHVGKDETKGARGWSGIKAAADAELVVTRDGDDRSLEITKMKDGQDGTAFPFKLTTVAIGTDADGDVITSCVVQHLDQAPAKKREPKGPRAKHLWRVLNELMDLGGEGVTVDNLISAAIERSEGDIPARPSFTYRQSLTGLVGKGFAAIEGGVVRIA
jgi:hypothetical protein